MEEKEVNLLNPNVNFFYKLKHRHFKSLISNLKNDDEIINVLLLIISQIIILCI